MSQPWPSLEDLALLVLVGETGSFGRAASTCGQSQPSVSRRIAALERSLRVELFRRGPSGSTLTPAGRVVLDWAASLLEAAEDFNRSVDALRARRSVMLRAAASMTIAEYLAPAWLQRVRQRSPETSVSLQVANSTEVANAVESGHADIGFLESPTVRPGLRKRRIGYDQVAVVVSPEHTWAERRSVPAAELARTPLLVREKGSGTRETLEYALGRSGLALTPSMEVASNTAVKSAAVGGGGPAVISRLALTHELQTGALVEVAVDGVDLRRPLTAVWRREQDLTEQAVLLYGVARTGLTDAPCRYSEIP
jgi:DNA-binding transcriptional LysR family regulator